MTVGPWWCDGTVGPQDETALPPPAHPPPPLLPGPAGDPPRPGPDRLLELLGPPGWVKYL